MEWRNLSVRDRAKFIHLFVKGGILTTKEQEKFYNDSIVNTPVTNKTLINTKAEGGHLFDGDPTKEDVRAAEVEQAFKNAMRTRSFDPYFGQTSGFSYDVFPNSFQKQEDANVPMSWGISLDIPIVKSARVEEMPNDPHDDYYGSLDLYAKNAYPNGFKWNLSGNYTKGGTAQDDIMSIQGGVGYRHIPTGLFGEFSAGYNKTGNPLQHHGVTTTGSIGYSRNIGEKQELKRQKAEALLKEIEEEKRLQEEQNNEKANGGPIRFYHNDNKGKNQYINKNHYYRTQKGNYGVNATPFIEEKVYPYGSVWKGDMRNYRQEITGRTYNQKYSEGLNIVPNIIGNVLEIPTNRMQSQQKVINTYNPQGTLLKQVVKTYDHSLPLGQRRTKSVYEYANPGMKLFAPELNLYNSTNAVDVLNSVNRR